MTKNSVRLTMALALLTALALPTLASAAQTLYPGFGYAEPGFTYRFGAEVNREFLQAYWKHEKRTFETEKEFEATFTAEYVASLGADLAVIEVLKSFTVNINGKATLCLRVKIRTRQTLETEMTVKYQQTKAWFELYKAPKSLFGTPNWTLCGKTYQIVEEGTGEQVVTGPTAREDESADVRLFARIRDELIGGRCPVLGLVADGIERTPAAERETVRPFVAELADLQRFSALNGAPADPSSLGDPATTRDLERIFSAMGESL